MAVLVAEPAEQGGGAAEDGEGGDLLTLQGVHATEPGDGVRMLRGQQSAATTQPARESGSMGITLRRLNRCRQLAGPTREEDIMKRPRRCVIVGTAMAAIGLAAATAGAVASVSGA